MYVQENRLYISGFVLSVISSGPWNISPVDKRGLTHKDTCSSLTPYPLGKVICLP